MTTARTLSLEALSARVEEIFVNVGLTADQAGAMARVIVAGERDGAKSHGIHRLEGCLTTLRAGKVSASAVPKLQEDESAIVRVTARGGFACAAFELGLPHLVEGVRQFGLAALVINDAAHFSALWYEVEALAEQGLAALAMCPSYSTVAPAGGSAPLLGTNPIAFGWPREDGPPYVFDFATSMAARGEIELHRRSGKPLPEGWAVDADGRPTTDPDAALAGAMLPFGGHKGSALSTMIELMAGALIGDRSSGDALDAIGTTSLIPTHGELVLAFDPAQFAAGRGTDPFGQAETLFEAIVGQGARLPSQRRYAARERTMAHGVTLTAAEMDQLDRYQALGLDGVSQRRTDVSSEREA
ncbi:Ldh family oxidoreductase [Rhodococcus sp. NPDC056960]|uniref:Ldh family oxidoreductase n=1 Tax=Rhodococcus sp. NPDC056960 TaxID=3345982 RepID=UPI0036261486